MTIRAFENAEMDNQPVPPGESQADFIKEELNFDVDPNDPLTKNTLSDHPEDEWMDILGNGQLRKKVIKSGQKNARPNRGDICTVKLTGKLENGTVVEENEELVIQLGDVEVVQGLDLAIALMDTGEVAEIEVTSRFAYGDLGKEPNIPSAATIFYVVELKSFKMDEEIESLNASQRKEIGNRKKERGNWWFTRNEPTLAIQCYRRALEYLQPEIEADETTTDIELQNLLEDRMKIYNNLAAAQIKTQAYDVALKSVESVLSCQPQNVKALFRKGKILHYKGQHASAYATFQQAAKICPDDKAIQQELAILKEKYAKDVKHEKNLYRKMLGANKTSNNNNSPKNVKKQKGVKSKSKLAWGLFGGVTVAVIGVLVYRFSS